MDVGAFFENIAVSDFDVGRCAAIVSQILGLASNDCAVVAAVVLPHDGACVDSHAAFNPAAFANDGGLINNGKRSDFDGFVDLRCWMNDG